MAGGFGTELNAVLHRPDCATVGRQIEIAGRNPAMASQK